MKKGEKNLSHGNRSLLAFFLIGSIILSGALYLYQVNDLATKGFEIRDLETKIAQLEKERKNIQIKEVELRSMHNVEKAAQSLEVINPGNITYLEIPGPFAMK